MIGQNREENDFDWLFTTVVYQRIENGERANQIHRFTKDHFKFILIIVIWQALRAGKMNQIPHCDWLAEQARWSDTAYSGLLVLFLQ